MLLISLILRLIYKPMIIEDKRHPLSFHFIFITFVWTSTLSLPSDKKSSNPYSSLLTYTIPPQYQTEDSGESHGKAIRIYKSLLKLIISLIGIWWEKLLYLISFRDIIGIGSTFFVTSEFRGSFIHTANSQFLGTMYKVYKVTLHIFL